MPAAGCARQRWLGVPLVPDLGTLAPVAVLGA
jgi:hypothetical protein